MISITNDQLKNVKPGFVKSVNIVMENAKIMTPFSRSDIKEIDRRNVIWKLTKVWRLTKVTSICHTGIQFAIICIDLGIRSVTVKVGI